MKKVLLTGGSGAQGMALAEKIITFGVWQLITEGRNLVIEADPLKHRDVRVRDQIAGVIADVQLDIVFILRLYSTGAFENSTKLTSFRQKIYLTW